jgi:hypothetical protein
MVLLSPPPTPLLHPPVGRPNPLAAAHSPPPSAGWPRGCAAPPFSLCVREKQGGSPRARSRRQPRGEGHGRGHGGGLPSRAAVWACALSASSGRPSRAAGDGGAEASSFRQGKARARGRSAPHPCAHLSLRADLPPAHGRKGRRGSREQGGAGPLCRWRSSAGTVAGAAAALATEALSLTSGTTTTRGAAVELCPTMQHRARRRRGGEREREERERKVMTCGSHVHVSSTSAQPSSKTPDGQICTVLIVQGQSVGDRPRGPLKRWGNPHLNSRIK